MKLTASFLRSILLLLFCLALSAVRAEVVAETVVGFQAPPSNPSAGALTLGPDGFYWGTTQGGGAYGFGTVYKVRAGGYHWVTVVSFAGDDKLGTGAVPMGGLVSDGKGFLWGTTSLGDVHGCGTVFKVQAATGVLTTVVKFTGNGATNKGKASRGTLVSDGRGNLWGTTSNGGAGDFGTVFKVNINTGVLTTLAEFTHDGAINKGSFPVSGLVNDGKGFLWGTTSQGGGGDNSGTVYKVSRLTGVLTTVAKLSSVGGSLPLGGLVLDGSGNLWGTTSRDGALGYGTIFKVNVVTGRLKRVVQFRGVESKNAGAEPQSTMVRDGQGFLWGTTYRGGTYDEGTIFKLNIATGVLTTLVSFGGVGEWNTEGKPLGGLLMDAKGYVWGTTREDGEGNLGTVYKVRRTTGARTTVVNFRSRIRQSYAGLVSDGQGMLWGTSLYGGLYNQGTIFKVNPETREVTRVASFTDDREITNGAVPVATLVSDGNGFFWGTTTSGGVHGYGTVFKVKMDTGVLTTVVEFTNMGEENKGANPRGALTNDGTGFLWGTTRWGGAGFGGTIYKVNIQTGALTTVVELSDSGATDDGLWPVAGLFNNGDGTLWGTTVLGGAYGEGTVYKVNATTGKLTTVANFTNKGLENRSVIPQGELVSDGNGSLWGTTAGAGLAGEGTVFKVDTATGVLTTVAELGAAAGNPQAGLVSDGSGNFVGTTSGYPLDFGTVFRVNATTGLVTTIMEFTGTGPQANSGEDPGNGALFRHTDGYFYGTTRLGGPGGGGVIYRLPVAP